MSKILSKNALKALNRIGDIIIPENGEFPKFSDTASIQHIDDLLAYAPENDIKDLNMLLIILSFMPGFVLAWLVKKMETSRENKGALGTLFRQLDFGVKGLIFSCYYSGKTGDGYNGKNPLDIIGYEIERVED
ncbi:MAG: hypothetical protein WD048_11355 [Chitinophagales bacterium]